MAIFRLRVNVISRARGQSVIASAAYRSGEKLHDPDRARDHDYTRRHGIEHTEIMAPGHAPAWLQVTAKEQEHTVRQLLWQRVEESERKKNSQLAREVVIALPHELDFHQRKQLVRDFVERNFIAKGMIADVSMHAPGPGDNPRNFHAHILLTMREPTQEGFARHKRRDWNDHALTLEWRQDWERTANHHLERAGREERIDHRSNQARGIDREPQPKLGPIAHEIEKSGRRSEAGDAIRAVKERNLHREIGVLGARALDQFERAATEAQHPLIKDQALTQLERLLDQLDAVGPERLSAADRQHDATVGRAERGLSRIADGALRAAGGILSFFEVAPAPKQISLETEEERLAKLEALRDQLLREDYAQAQTAAWAQERSRADDDEAMHRRERDRFK